jgi:hypothetical protein
MCSPSQSAVEVVFSRLIYYDHACNCPGDDRGGEQQPALKDTREMVFQPLCFANFTIIGGSRRDWFYFAHFSLYVTASPLISKFS